MVLRYHIQVLKFIILHNSKKGPFLFHQTTAIPKNTALALGASFSPQRITPSTAPTNNPLGNVGNSAKAVVPGVVVNVVDCVREPRSGDVLSSIPVNWIYETAMFEVFRQ